MSDIITIDLHMCVERSERYVEVMSEAGASRFIFQYEAHKSSCFELARRIKENKMKCGVSLNPGTPVEDIYPLLKTGLVDLVDLLAVNPGFGGQLFQDIALEKIRTLKGWIKANDIELSVMVDGGVNMDTAPRIAKSGADIMVTGSYLFGNKDMKAAAEKLLCSVQDQVETSQHTSL